jgi:long-chain acyl-CoA synthetase
LGLPLGFSQRRYLNDPDATAATFRGRWIQTTDLGFVDGRGCLHLVGRALDFVNVSGRKVLCADVEKAYEAHPGVIEAAAFAGHDSTLGEEIWLAVVADPGIDRTDLDRHAAERLPPHKRPARLKVVESLPRTRNGKVVKADLPALFAAEPADQGYGVAEAVRRAVTEVLDVADLAGDPSLSDLGATSLSMLRVHTRLTELLGFDVDIALLPMAPSISALAQAIAAARKDGTDVPG